MNRSKDTGPGSRLKSGGLERPIAARFDRAGKALYVVDFGVLRMDEKGSHPEPETGSLWRIVRKGVGAMPAFSETMLSDQDLEKVAKYVQALRKAR